MLKPITSSETVEIQIADLINKKYTFLENLNLRGWKIKYFFSAPADSNFKTPLNRASVGTSNILALQSSYATLRNDTTDEDDLSKLPLSHLEMFEGTGSTGSVLLPQIDKIVNIPKSFIEISDLTHFSTAESFLLTYLYNENKQPSEKIDFSKVKMENMEVVINSTSAQKFYFSDNEKLRNKKIVKIEVLGPTTTVITPSGYSQQLYYYLTLNVAGNDRINNLASYFLMRNNCQLNQMIFDYIKVDWPKSFISLPAAQGSSNFAACLQIYYVD